MRIVFFYHSLISDWNHGNAHFLRGIVGELRSRGAEVRVYEPALGWSLQNLIRDHGTVPIRRFRTVYPGLESIAYDPLHLDIDAALDGADLVMVHEWNEHDLVARIGAYRARARNHILLFHDSHHRAVTDPAAMESYDLSHYDGVLAFGSVLRDLYLSRGWAQHAWTWHEAADTRLFRPLAYASRAHDLVWIGNWGDNARTAELDEFLIEPVRKLQLDAHVYGVRYPDRALAALKAARIAYGGWLPNFDVPRICAAHRATVHIPAKSYASALPGIPTIRVFEALACGIPLISAPWSDTERLFTTGVDYLVAQSGEEMKQSLRAVLSDADFATELAQSGVSTIQKRHTCAHRVDELLAICRSIAPETPIAGGTTSAIASASRALLERGHHIAFFEPGAYERRRHRDISDPPWVSGHVSVREDSRS